MGVENITIGLTSTSTGWIGFGIGSTMKNADMAIGYVDNTGPHVYDCFSTGHSPPAIDRINNILDFNGQEVNGQTTIKFVRKLDTGDTQQDRVIVPGTVDIIVAFQSSTDMNVEHSGSNKGSYTINFVTGALTQTGTGLAIHGFLMALGWVVCTVIAQFLAKFFKHIGHKWFILHIVFNVIGLVLILIAFILAIVFATEGFLAKKDKIILLHSWLGLLIIILAFLQPILGYLADKYWKPDRLKTPIWPDKIHWYIGRGAQFLAFINILIGFFIYGVKWYIYGIYFVCLTIIVVLYIVLLVRRRNDPIPYGQMALTKFVDEE